MGCGVSASTREKSYSSSLIRKLTPNYQRSFSNSGTNTTLSRLNSANPIPCLNLKILPNDLKILQLSINLAGTEISTTSFKFMKSFNTIKEAFIRYTSNKRYFDAKVHEVCFKHFEVPDGIFIMLVSLYANEDLSIKFSSSFPFISVKGMMEPETDEIFKSWSDYINDIESLNKNNCELLRTCLQKMENLLTILHKSLEFTIRVRKINRAIKATEEAIEVSKTMINESQRTKTQISQFFAKINQKLPDIQYYAGKAGKFQLFTGEKIVHRLLQGN